MNYAQSLTHIPDGEGLRWLNVQVYYWLNPRVNTPRRKNVEFSEAVVKLVTEFPRSLHQIYEMLPARFRTVQDYRNLETQLRRMSKDGRVARVGSSGHYKYGRV